MNKRIKMMNNGKMNNNNLELLNNMKQAKK